MSADLESRVQRAERAVKRWRVVSAVALLASIVSFLPPIVALRAGESRARAFVLLDAAGQEVARLGEVVDGVPSLRLDLGKDRGTLSLGGLGADLYGFSFIAPNSRIAITTEGGRSPMLSLSDPTRKIVAGIQGTTTPTLLMMDGQTNLAARASPPGVRFKDNSGVTVYSRKGPEDGREAAPW